jgi:hypothetical protein
MTSTRTIATVTGVLFLITFITSIPAAFVGVLFGGFAQVSLPAAIATIPEFLWELSLGIYLTVKGFTPSPITAAYEREVGQAAGAG